MDSIERKAHWEKVFQTKDTTKVSWFQSRPETSLQIIEKLNVAKSSKIIEVGCGDSLLGDFLLDKGYSDITLLDISEKALDTIKSRLKEKTKQVTFIAADVTEFQPKDKYQLWHDRAVFHFLTDKNDIQKYVENVSTSVKKGGYLILGTFAQDGPHMCSDLKIEQYSEEKMTETFHKNFRKKECFTEIHTTPSGGKQNFLFCIFQRK